MLIVNDNLKLSEGYFSETFLGFYIDDDIGYKIEVVAKQVTMNVVRNQIIKEKRLEESLKKEESSKIIGVYVTYNEIQTKKNQLLKLLENEARIAKLLSHSNLVKMIGFQKFKGTESLLYEYADCGSLKERMGKNKKFSFAEIADFLDQITNGLSYIHGFSEIHSLIHMDINPGNIFYCSDGKIKIGDFGLTVEAPIEILNKEVICSSGNFLYSNIIYASPEVIHSKKAYQSSDLWSIAIILYQLLTGKEPKIKNEFINIIAKDSESRKKIINHISNELRKIYINSKIINEFIYIINQLLSDPGKTSFKSGIQLRLYLDKLQFNKDSELGKLLKNIRKYHNKLLIANIEIKEINKYFIKINESLSADADIKRVINILENLLIDKETKIKSLETIIDEAKKALNIKKNNKKLSGVVNYNYEEKLKDKYLKIFSKVFFEIRDSFIEAINCFKVVANINSYASDCAYLYVRSILAIAEMEIQYNKDKALEILSNSSENLLNFVKVISKRPSFINLFNIEKLFSIFLRLNSNYSNNCYEYLKILNDKNLSSEEKLKKMEEQLKKMGIDIKVLDDDNDVDINISESLLNYFRRITEFNEIKTKLYNFMFQSLIN